MVVRGLLGLLGSQGSPFVNDADRTPLPEVHVAALSHDVESAVLGGKFKETWQMDAGLSPHFAVPHTVTWYRNVSSCHVNGLAWEEVANADRSKGLPSTLTDLTLTGITG